MWLRGPGLHSVALVMCTQTTYDYVIFPNQVATSIKQKNATHAQQHDMHIVIKESAPNKSCVRLPSSHMLFFFFTLLSRYKTRINRSDSGVTAYAFVVFLSIHNISCICGFINSLQSTGRECNSKRSFQIRADFIIFPFDSIHRIDRKKLFFLFRLLVTKIKISLKRRKRSDFSQNKQLTNVG